MGSGSRIARAVLAFACALVFVPAAGASSIVFIKSHDVWVIQPSGKGARAVTTNGTRAKPYRSPSQDDAGRIVAERGKLLYRLNRSGAELNKPFRIEEGGGPDSSERPIDPAVSPNGKKIAFWLLAKCADSGGIGTSPCSKLQFTRSSRFTSPGALYAGDGSGYRRDAGDPSWISSSQVIYTSVYTGFSVSTEVLGGSVNRWFDDADYGVPLDQWQKHDDAEVTRDRTKVVALRSSGRQIRFFDIGSGGFGSPPQLRSCQWQVGSGRYTDPSWAPDGSRIAVAYGGAVYLADIPGGGDCSQGKIARLTAGSEPDWGPAG